MEVTIDMVDMSMLAVIPPFPVRYGLSQSRSGSQEAKYSALRLIESKSPSEGLMPSLPKNSQRGDLFRIGPAQGATFDPKASRWSHMRDPMSDTPRPTPRGPRDVHKCPLVTQPRIFPQLAQQRSYFDPSLSYFASLLLVLPPLRFPSAQHGYG